MPLLVVQMGHCYRITGATGTNGEQDFATRVANDCASLLSRNGWSVKVIHADESTSAYRGDAFVAIHADGSTNTSVRGASVGYRTPEGQTFGQAWKRAYADRGWPGGFRADNYTTALAQYYGTGNAVGQGNRRAIIVECGFLTSPDDRAVLNSGGAMSGTNRVALAIGDALGITAATPPPQPPPQQEEDMDPVDKNILERASWRIGAVAQMRPRLDVKLTPVPTGGADDELHEDVKIVQTVLDLVAGMADLKAKVDTLLARIPNPPQV